MGDDSTDRRVLALCRGSEPLYRIVPHRGRPFVVNENHLLSLVSTCEGKKYRNTQQGGEITDIPLKEYLTKSASWRHLRKLYCVAVDYEERSDLPIPPYMLGLILGDGCLLDCVSLTTADEELAHEFAQYGRSMGCDLQVRESDGRVPIYSLTSRSGKQNLILDAFEELGLRGRAIARCQVRWYRWRSSISV